MMIYRLGRMFSIPFHTFYVHAWIFILCLLLLICIGGYLSMGYSGEKEIIKNFTWWFFVTATTVGYENYYPINGAVRTMTGTIILLGIGVLTLMIVKTTKAIFDVIYKRTKGLEK